MHCADLTAFGFFKGGDNSKKHFYSGVSFFPSFQSRCVSESATGKAQRETYFEQDIVQYGSRYDRPDRFAQVRKPKNNDGTLDIQEWILNFYDISREFNGCPEEVYSQHSDLNESIDPEIVSKHKMLLQSGRLDECLEVLQKTSRLHPNGPAAIEASRPLLPSFSKQTRHVNHLGVCIAALEAGSVDIAFEYAGNLPPSIYVYNVLLASMVRFEQWTALHLPVETAKRRGLTPDSVSVLLEIYGKLKRSELQEAKEFAKNLSRKDGLPIDELDLFERLQKLLRV